MPETLEQDLVTVATPKVSDLIAEYCRAGVGGSSGLSVRDAEDTRLCVWSGQSPDGRRWQDNAPNGEEVLPWDGCSDIRPMLVDGVVNEQAALLYAAFWRSVLHLQGVDANDAESASVARTYLDWLLHSRLAAQLDAEVDLASQWVRSFGWCGLQVSWQRELRRKPLKVTLELLAKIEEVRGGSSGGMPLPLLVQDPTLEDIAVDMVTNLAEEFMAGQLPADVLEQELKPLTAKQARKCVRELRETGQTTVPMPYLAVNEPRFRALKPGVEVILPAESEDGSPMHFVRVLMTEPQLRAMQFNAEWDAEWIAAAATTKGMLSTWEADSWTTMTGAGSRMTAEGWRAVDTRRHFIEVVYGYHDGLDDGGFACRYYTVFSPHVGRNEAGDRELYAIQAPLEYPGDKAAVIFLRKERTDRAVVSSRGDCEVLRGWQWLAKKQADSAANLADLAVIPPRLVPKGLGGTRFSFGPAAENEYRPGGGEPKFMDIPKSGAPLATDMLVGIQNQVARYMGLFDESVPAALNQLLQEPSVKRWLAGWTEALKLAYELGLKYAPEVIARVTGQPPEALPNAEEAGFDYTLGMDVGQFSPDLWDMKLKALSALLPEDAAGTLDRAKLTALKARMIAPDLARELIVDQGAASQAMVREVDAALVSMFAGNEAQYTDASNDPSAPFKLKTAAELLRKNVKYLMALTDEAVQKLIEAQVMDPMTAQQLAQAGQMRKPDPWFSAYLVKYIENLKQGAVQQENKTVGRLGVKPGA